MVSDDGLVGGGQPATRSSAEEAVVFVVDDDAIVRDSVVALCRSIALVAHGYGQAEDFLAADVSVAKPACVVLDVRMPGMGGLELLRQLHTKHVGWPTVVVTGHADVPLTIEAMRLGAIDVLEKPFHPQRLIDAVQTAVRLSRHRVVLQQRRHEVSSRIEIMSMREREVLGGILTGKSSKEIARDLGISSKTVDNHRSAVLKKMDVDSVARLFCRVFDLPDDLGKMLNLPAHQ